MFYMHLRASITLSSVYSDADKQAFQTWQQYDDVEDSFCEPDGKFRFLMWEIGDTESSSFSNFSIV